eukprot:scaffold23297_cov132-Cylindrotheca_fusiformis.AAC.17
MPQKSKNPLTAMTAGCIAGAVEATCVWPMEYIKTQLQLQSKAAGSKPRGLAPTLVGSVPKAGIRFGGNSLIKESLRDKNGDLSPAKNFVAGLGAGVSEALIVVAPVETVKTKVIELNMPFVTGLKHIVKTEGISGIYKGAFATALKQGSNQGLRFMWFNEYKRRMTSNGETNLTPLLSFLGGMSAGCFSTLGNNPFDVIKTRLQGSKGSHYTGTLDCLKKILKNEGFLALYAGVVPRLGRVVPGQGIIFMSFESIQRTLESSFSIFKP